jgi:protein-disulfide isomerase
MDAPPPQNDTPNDTITLKRSHFYAALLPLAFVAGLAAGYIFWGRTIQAVPSEPVAQARSEAPTADSAAASAATEAAGNSTAGSTAPTRYDVPIDDDPILGPQDAPITLIEFSDYECPYCRKWHAEVFPRLQEAFPGQIRYVYRDFPLVSIHSNAAPAAEAANCAGDQEKYWEYNEMLFSMERSLNQESYVEYARELALDIDQFSQCLESRQYQEEVSSDYEYAANLGIRSTPTFFINGIAIVGAQPFEVFEDLINKELAGEIP